MAEPTEAMVEAGVRALHIEMSRQNVDAYLDGDFDLGALATACLTAALQPTGEGK